MKTGAALFLCLAMATPASAQTTMKQKCQGTAIELMKLGQLMAQTSDKLSQMPYDKFELILPAPALPLKEEAVKTQAELLAAIDNFIETQLKLVMALRGCS